MPINLYEKPAEYQFINTYVPFEPVAEFLYKRGTSKQAKHDANKAEAKKLADAEMETAWYDAYWKTKKKTEVNNAISELSKRVDPSTNEFVMGVSSILSDPKFSGFAAVSKESMKPAAQLLELKTDDMDNLSKWKVESTIDVLQDWNRRGQGGTGYLMATHQDVFSLPKTEKSLDYEKDWNSQIGALHLDKKSWGNTSEDLMENIKGGREWLSRKRIANMAGWDYNPETGAYYVANLDSFMATKQGVAFNRDVISDVIHNSGLEDDLNADKTIEAALNAKDDADVVFTSHKSLDPMASVKASDVKKAYWSSFQERANGVMDRLFANEVNRISNEEYKTSYALKKKDDKDAAVAIPPLKTPTEGETWSIGTVSDNYNKATVNSYNAKNDYYNTTKSILKTLWGVDPGGNQDENEKHLGTIMATFVKGANGKYTSTVKQYNDAMAAAGVTAEQLYAQWNTSYSTYRNAKAEQFNAKNDVVSQYDKFSSSGDKKVNGWKKDAYKVISGIDNVPGLSEDNVDKFIMAIRYPDQFGDQFFKSVADAKKYEHLLGNSNVDWYAKNFKEKYEEYSKNNPIMAGGDLYTVKQVNDNRAESIYISQIKKDITDRPQILQSYKLVGAGGDPTEYIAKKLNLDIDDPNLWATIKDKYIVDVSTLHGAYTGSEGNIEVSLTPKSKKGESNGAPIRIRLATPHDMNWSYAQKQNAIISEEGYRNGTIDHGSFNEDIRVLGQQQMLQVETSDPDKESWYTTRDGRQFRVVPVMVAGKRAYNMGVYNASTGLYDPIGSKTIRYAIGSDVPHKLQDIQAVIGLYSVWGMGDDEKSMYTPTNTHSKVGDYSSQDNIPSSDNEKE